MPDVAGPDVAGRAPPARLSLGTIVALALPAAASAILNNAFRLVDQVSVQWLGTPAQAAVAACGFVTILLFACFTLVSAGAGPMVARRNGAGDGPGQRRVLGNALVGSLGVGLLSLGLLAVGAPAVVASTGLQGPTAALATTYLRWLALAGAPLALAPLIDSVLVAMGHTGTMMLLQLVAAVLNALVNALFIYGLGMGIAGAALATGLSRGVVVVVGLVLLWRRTGMQPGSLVAELRPGPELVRMVGLGLPIALNLATYALVYQALICFAVAPLGIEVVAALGIGFNGLESVSWPMFWGLSMALASLVGRSLGAGEPAQATRAIRLSLPLSLGAGLGVMVVFLLLARPLCSRFTSDPVVLEQAVLYARILALSQPFVAIEALSEGVLEGSGATGTVLAWSLPLNLLRVPLAWGLALGLGLGPAGIWWAINLTTVAKALGKGGAVLLGRWRSVVV